MPLFLLISLPLPQGSSPLLLRPLDLHWDSRFSVSRRPTSLHRPPPARTAASPGVPRVRSEGRPRPPRLEYLREGVGKVALALHPLPLPPPWSPRARRSLQAVLETKLSWKRRGRQEKGRADDRENGGREAWRGGRKASPAQPGDATYLEQQQERGDAGVPRAHGGPSSGRVLRSLAGRECGRTSANSQVLGSSRRGRAGLRRGLQVSLEGTAPGTADWLRLHLPPTANERRGLASASSADSGVVGFHPLQAAAAH